MTQCIIFDGQGSIPNMLGSNLITEHHSAAKKFFLLAHSLGFDSVEELLDVDLETTTQTWYMQPFIFTYEAFIYDIVNPSKNSTNTFYGHSLGLYAALYASGLMGFDELLRIVIRRGYCMQKTSETNKTGLLAVLSYDFDLISYICAVASTEGKTIYVANRNSYGETVVGGELDRLATVHELFNDFGIRSIQLSVSGAFHTPYMAEAKSAFSSYFGESTITSETNDRIYLDPSMESLARWNEILVEQITEPTNFVSVMRKMVEEGVDDFVEIGPRRVLSKYVNEMAPNCTTSFLI